LFVLNSYTSYSSDKIFEARLLFKNIFKTHFKTYFKNHSGFDFYEFNFNSEQELKEFVDVVKDVRYADLSYFDWDDAYRYEARCERFLDECSKLVCGE